LGKNIESQEELEKTFNYLVVFVNIQFAKKYILAAKLWTYNAWPKNLGYCVFTKSNKWPICVCLLSC